jgi:anti-sigma regulatory factor (Ser/Thr protein kinase)
MTVTGSRSLLLQEGATAAGSARTHARAACAGATSPDLSDDVALVVSELVTNALRHGRGEVRLDLHIDPGQVFVAVWDAGPPFDWANESAHHGALTGRGLSIVAALAANYGVRSDFHTGKSVWCVVQAAAAQ